MEENDLHHIVFAGENLSLAGRRPKHPKIRNKTVLQRSNWRITMAYYTCQNCGVTAKMSSNLCNPIREEVESKFCGNSADQVCLDELKTMKYSCNACGSVSADAVHLCNPSEIK